MDQDVPTLLSKRRFSQAFERMVDLYETKVFHMAVMFLKDNARAEEVTQDIFLKLWQALPSYDGRASPSTWLYTIARNTCLTVLRAESHRKTVVLDRTNEPASPPKDAATALNLAQCVERLPEEQREVITLFYLQEKSVQDVSRMLDLPEGTVKSHLHRARVALAAMMKE